MAPTGVSKQGKEKGTARKVSDVFEEPTIN